MTNLTQSDIDAIICSLEVTLSCDLCNDIDNLLGVSAAKKLISRQHLSNPESLFVAHSVDNAYKILRNEISVDDESAASLRSYFFTINKLHPVFLSLLSQ